MAVESLYREPEAAPGQIQWAALEFHDVFKIYRSGPVETVALRGFDLEVQEGEFVAVLGPSGSGKSTFLSLAGGLDRPSAGEVRALGRSLNMLDEVELARYRATDLAVVFQSDNLWSTLSARENVAVSLRLAGSAEPERRAEEALRAVGLGPRAGHRVAELSGGEQQRVAIAAAAARKASLVLADEPTGELDSDNEKAVLEVLHILPEQRSALIVVTHSERVAASADRVVELRDGVVVA